MKVLSIHRVLLLAPLERLAVQVIEIIERSAREKVSFDEVERPFDTPFSVGVPLLVRDEVTKQSVSPFGLIYASFTSPSCDSTPSRNTFDVITKWVSVRYMAE